MNKGIILILLGYIGWGLFPLYWGLVTHVSPLEVLAHRMLWSVPVLLIFVALVASWRADVFQAIKNKKELAFLLVTAILISSNWGFYVYAVNVGKVVEASMGYFLSPLIQVLAGLILFKEKLGPLRKLAVAFATAGIFYYIFTVGIFPTIGLILAFSFAFYSILRKFIQTPAVPGLLIETLLLAPFSLGFLIYLSINNQAVFLNFNFSTDTYLALAGLVTVIPLVLFTSGARLLPMTTTGILAYITPTMQFLLGIFIFKEALNINQLIGFIGIWIGLIIYAFSLIKRSKEAEV